MARPSRKLERQLEEIDRRADANDLLTLEDRERIKAKAREHVAAQLAERRKAQKALLEADYLERAVRDEEKAAGLHGAYVDLTVDVAANAAFITLDGVSYFHGLTYEVPENVAATLYDIMARTWEHENETHGLRRRADVGRRQQPRVMRAGLERSSLGEPGNINSRTLPVV